jgi:endonuclease III
MPPRKVSRLQRVLDRLESALGIPAAPRLGSVFAHVAWENIAYLVDDDRRAAAFAALKRSTRLRAEAVLGMPLAELVELCRLGGIHPELRAKRLQQSAQLALADGDDASVLGLEPRKAMRLLQRYPAIGRPGAEKILLFTGTAPLLALESNGLRALLRLGYGTEHKGYDQSYRSAQAAAAAELPATVAALQRAYLLLRQLGQSVCRRSAPDCAACPARALCPTGSPAALRPRAP